MLSDRVKREIQERFEPGCRVYVAGPYSSNPEANVGRAMAVWHELKDLGFHPYLPHLSHFLHLVRPRAYEEWLAYDLIELRLCHALLRLDGNSAGADLEVEEAGRMAIPIVFCEDDELLR